MYFFRFGMNDMNNTTIINTFNSDNGSITKIKTQHCQIMTTITNLKFKTMIKKPIVTNNTFFTGVTLSNVSFFT